MKRVFRNLAWWLPLLGVLGCTKKDEPIPLPPEPSATSTSAVTTAIDAGLDSSSATGPTATGAVPVATPGTTGTVQPPVDGGKGADGGPATGIPPFPQPPAGFPTGLPIPSGLPAIPTALPSAFPFPMPKSS